MTIKNRILVVLEAKAVIVQKGVVRIEFKLSALSYQLLA
jgi:hypothetical protein